MPSALGVSNYQGSQVDTSVPDGSNYHGDSWFSQLGSAFGASNEKQQYANLITENNRAYEQATIRDQRAYEDYERNWNKYLDDTLIQRRVEDIKAAGLNPWLALNSGGFGASSPTATSSSTVSPGSGSSAKAVERSKSNGISALAMLLMSSAKLISLMV